MFYNYNIVILISDVVILRIWFCDVAELSRYSPVVECKLINFSKSTVSIHHEKFGAHSSIAQRLAEVFFCAGNMPREAEPSNLEKEFILEALHENLRIDGRGFDQFRNVDLTFGDDYGSVTVQLGRTR